MIFFLVMPGLFGGFGNYFVPIFQGSPEVVYPRVNNFSILILIHRFMIQNLKTGSYYKRKKFLGADGKLLTFNLSAIWISNLLFLYKHLLIETHIVNYEKVSVCKVRTQDPENFG